MRHYRRKYSDGEVRPYAKKYRGVESEPKWRATIKEGTVTEVVDANGETVMENGKPKTTIKWRNVSKTFPEIDCRVYTSGKCKGQNRGKREAEAALAEWREQLVAQAEEDYRNAIAMDNGEERRRKFSYAQMGVADFLDLYLEERKADGLEASTLEGYAYTFKYVTKYFGNRPIGEITTEDLKEFNRSMIERDLSSTTRSKALKLLKAAYDAHERQIGEENPFIEFKKSMPTPKEGNPNPLDARSLDTLKKILEDSPATAFMAAVEIALRTGMRVGEICGLKWSDVDPETGTVTVRHAIGRTKGGTKCYVKGPKDTSRDKKRDPTRTIPGSPKIKAMFAKRRAYVEGELRDANAKEEDLDAIIADLYVVGTIDGKYANPTVLGRTWRGFSQQLTGVTGKRPTFHDLRDTYASYAMDDTEGGSIGGLTVAAILGHRDPTITVTRYAKALDASKKRAQLTMDNIF